MDRVKTQSLWESRENQVTARAQSLGDLLSTTALRFPDQEAVVYACNDQPRQSGVSNVRWTYEEINSKAEKLGAALLDYGYQPGDRVAIWGPNHPEWILLEYALAKAGLILVAINPLYKKMELEFALNASEVKGIFHVDRVQSTPLRTLIDDIKSKVPSLTHIHSFSRDVSNMLKSNALLPASFKVDPSQTFMIQYTSGTTGKPKAAQLTHEGIVRTATHSYESWGFISGDKVCHGFPLFHVGGAGNSTPGAASVGATTLPLYIFNARQTLDILEQEQCTGFIGVPTMLTAMLDDSSFTERTLSSLRHIVVGGTSVAESLIERCEQAFGVEIINSYGLTEASGVVSSTEIHDSTIRKATTSGRALPGISLKVIDGQGGIQPVNTPGELCFQGPGLMQGYRNCPPELQAVDSQGWLHTGDRAEMDEDGYVRIVGRTKEMIIRGGENISPSEVESFLLGHASIVEAAVLGLPDSKYGEEVCAALIVRRGSKTTTQELRDWCLANLSRWKVPKYIAFVENFPKTASGKTQKHKLKETLIAYFSLTEKN